MQPIWKELRKNAANYSLILPGLIYTIIFGYLTLPYMVIAFEKYNYMDGIFSQWVGLQNFEFFFKSNRAWMVTRNTLILNLAFTITGTFFSVLMALLINEIRSRLFARTMHTIMLLPHFLSWVVVSYILLALLNSRLGVINQAMQALGMKKINWYAKAEYWPTILIIMNLIKGTGYSSIVYLSVITGIDSEVYEASMIDGASNSQRIRFITLPLLMPTVCILTLMGIGRIFSADFGMYYALVRDNAILLETTDVIDTYVFRMLRTTGDPSMSMAIGMYQSFMGFIMVFGCNYLSRKFFPEGALF